MLCALGLRLSRLRSLSLYCVKGSVWFLQVTRVAESLHRLNPTAPRFPAVPAKTQLDPGTRGGADDEIFFFYAPSSQRSPLDVGVGVGIGEVAQQLRVLTAIAEDPSSSPGTHIRQLTSSCNPNSRVLDTLSSLHRHLHGDVYIHIQTLKK